MAFAKEFQFLQKKETCFIYNAYLHYAHYAYNRKERGMTCRELENLLLKDGWYMSNQVGSHRHFKHPFKKGKITIPMHKGDLKRKTADSILKQAGIQC